MDRNQLAFSREIRNAYDVMNMPKLFPLVATWAIFLGACQTGKVGTGGWRATGGAGENIEVRADEYDETFQYQYGLLYRALSNAPFTGRIVTVDFDNEKAYVSSEDFWYGGRRHGRSTRWASTGQKVWERNYKEGRWHGLVTRWWPSGQKMYVRVYSDGVRQDEEMTWRSDGSRFDASSPIPAPAVTPSADFGTPSVTGVPEMTEVPVAPVPPVEEPSGFDSSSPSRFTPAVEQPVPEPSAPNEQTFPEPLIPFAPAPAVEEPVSIPPSEPPLPDFGSPTDDPSLPAPIDSAVPPLGDSPTVTFPEDSSTSSPDPIDLNAIFGSDPGSVPATDPLAPLPLTPSPAPADPLAPFPVPADPLAPLPSVPSPAAPADPLAPLPLAPSPSPADPLAPSPDPSTPIPPLDPGLPAVDGSEPALPPLDGGAAPPPLPPLDDDLPF